MQHSTEYLQHNWRWWLGLVLTLVVIGLLTWNIVLTRQLVQQREFNSSRVTGYPTKRLDDIWLRVRSIEQVIHTMPLVECGDRNGRRPSK